MSNRVFYLTPSLMLRAYAAGIFPMAESALSSEIHWFDPPIRAVIPIEPEGDDSEKESPHFHVPARLRRTIRRFPYEIRLDTRFDDVVRGCAEAAPGRMTTWINQEIMDLYTTLHWRGHAHSIEVWDDKRLVGGLYGVHLGGAFFGESMFSRKPDASKIALVYLVALLRHLGFTLLDTQFQTDHLAHFGTYEMTRANYHHFLKQAVGLKRSFGLPKDTDWDHLVASFLQPVTQRS